MLSGDFSGVEGGRVIALDAGNGGQRRIRPGQRVGELQGTAGDVAAVGDESRSSDLRQQRSRRHLPPFRIEPFDEGIFPGNGLFHIGEAAAAQPVRLQRRGDRAVGQYHRDVTAFVHRPHPRPFQSVFDVGGTFGDPVGLRQTAERRHRQRGQQYPHPDHRQKLDQRKALFIFVARAHSTHLSHADIDLRIL